MTSKRQPSAMRHALYAMVSLLLVACGDNGGREIVDRLNDAAYRSHYVSLDSTVRYAGEALKRADGYGVGRMEAMNNLAFADLMRMDYRRAEERLDTILHQTDNQLELLVANVQMMRLCQRESRNKEFYDYYWNAMRNMKRIGEVRDGLSPRQRRRLVYAETEMRIVHSAYFYYAGQIDAFAEALDAIGIDGEIERDTAQLLNYYYNVGAGDYYHDGTPEDIAQREFDHLVRCYYLAQRGGYVFWQANALQAMSEHLQNRDMLQTLVETRQGIIRQLNQDHVADTLLAGNFAQKAALMFADYGDVCQTAGALRTLSDCFFQIGDHTSAILCLLEALERDTLINQTPAVTSSIYEKLSINYSALDDKPSSDYNRNLYLDLQEQTRQDSELEARAALLDSLSLQLNVMMAGVAGAIVLLSVLLLVLTRKRRRSEQRYTAESFLQPLNTWKARQVEATNAIAERQEEIAESQQQARLSLERSLQKNVEQRAKMSLVNSITPFIDRMIAEMRRLQGDDESPETKAARLAYIRELTDKIIEYNAQLTSWIQMRKGELSLKIESFPLQELFDIVAKGRASFAMKGVELAVEPTAATVKADKTLTLFMINTIADNARKATGEGGRVRISAEDTPDYVEIAVCDTGEGMDEAQLEEVMRGERLKLKGGSPSAAPHPASPGEQHGYGLMNCKGIIEKYRKVSQLFSVCQLTAESRRGFGSTFRFRLPHGVVRMMAAFAIGMQCMAAFPGSSPIPVVGEGETLAGQFADSAYFCNLQARYESTLQFADSVCFHLNRHYRELRPNAADTMSLRGSAPNDAAELRWFADSLPMPYEVILDMRNEAAVAALALHDWPAYNYNNKIYTRLFHEMSADHSLEDYVEQTKSASDAKNVAVVLLTLLLLSIIPAYYLLYYRYKVSSRSLVDRVRRINTALLEDMPNGDKTARIKSLWDKNERRRYAATRETAELGTVVEQIIEALEASAKIEQREAEETELAEDELRRLNYENSRLHVYNNVLDNCFSTLKHETMYYPSRIRQMADSPEPNIDALLELTLYYMKLYQMLSLQAQSQVRHNLRTDARLLSYLHSLLVRLSPAEQPEVSSEPAGEAYDVYTFAYQSLRLGEEEADSLFTPLTGNINCLLIRQIVREIGETTNLRGCGILARRRDDGGTDIVMTLPKKLNFKK